MVCMFSLTLLLLYKIGQLHMFATNTVGSCVCVSCMSFGSICNILPFGFPVRSVVQSFWLNHFDTVTI